MTNPFYLAGSASNVFRLFPKIKSTLKKRGHVDSEDVSKKGLEALKANWREGSPNVLNLHTASQVSASFEENNSFLCIHFGCLSKKWSCHFSLPLHKMNSIQPWGIPAQSMPRAHGDKNWMWMSLGKKPQRTRHQAWFPPWPFLFVREEKYLDSQTLSCSPICDKVAQLPPPLRPLGARGAYQGQ